MLPKNYGKANATRVAAVLWLYSLLVVLSTALNWAIYLLLRSPGRAFDFRPLFPKLYRFGDLTDYINKMAHLWHGAERLGSGFPVYNYPPVAALVYKLLLYSVPGHPVAPYMTFLVICTLALGLVAWLAVRQASLGLRIAAGAAILTTAVLGYPLWIVADRGNVEGVAWALAAAGLCFLLRARYGAAAVLIGLAAAVKPFPILFLLLLVSRRKYKEAMLGAATFGVAVLGALIFLGPNPWKAYQDLKPGVAIYTERYITNLAPVEEARFEHSLLDGMKSAALTVKMRGIHPNDAIMTVDMLRQPAGGWRQARALAHLYPYVICVGLALLFVVFRKQPLLNQLTALGAAVTLFPPSAADYTLLHLYVPFGALLVFLVREVATGKATMRRGSLVAFATVYALLFSPGSLLRIYAGDEKLLLLLALLVITARTPMRSAYFGDGADGRLLPMAEAVPLA
jgi:hypothetical protein